MTVDDIMLVHLRLNVRENNTKVEILPNHYPYRWLIGSKTTYKLFYPYKGTKDSRTFWFTTFLIKLK